MQVKNKGIYTQVSIRIISGFVLFTLITSALFYYRQYQTETQRSYKQFQALYFSVERAASLGLFYKIKKILPNLLQGLQKNKLVQHAYFVAPELIQKDKNTLLFPIFSPVDDSKVIQQLLIIPNKEFIHLNAFHASKQQIMILFFYSIILMLMSLFIVNKALIEPLKKIYLRFHRIMLGDTSRILIAKEWTENEIGDLARDINKLLNTVNAQIERERNLRNETEHLSKKFRLLFDRANVGIGLLDKKNHLVIANPTLLGLLTQRYIVNNDKCQPKEFTQYFQNPDQISDFIENFKIKYGDQFCALDTKLKHKARASDKWVHCILSKVEDIYGSEEHLLEVVLYDITSRSQRENNIIYDAEHDMLTGLYNRRASLPKLEASLEHAKNKNYYFALLMLDLDGFKDVNDNHGHDAGDKVITEVSRRIKQYFRGTDVVTRWGGDEFLIGFSYDPSYKTALADIVTDLQYQIALPISIGRERTSTVGSSIGISLFPLHGENIHTLLEKADIAMYQVKQQGKNSFSLYASQTQSTSPLF